MFTWNEPRTTLKVDINCKPPKGAVDFWIERKADPRLAIRLSLFMARMTLLGHDVAVTQLFRTPHEQEQMYLQGRSLPGKIITDAHAWQSAHCTTINGTPAAQAFDLAIRKGKSIIWDMNDDTAQFWSDARDTGNMLALTWGATFNKPPRDFGHFQLSTFKAIAP
jgi:hypothetical protein